MANMKDISTVPAVVTITNVAVREKAYDAGSLQRAKEADILVDDKNNKYVLTDGIRTVQLYRVNNFITLANGDSVKLTAETSEEVAYYESLNGKDFEVTVEAANA